MRYLTDRKRASGLGSGRAGTHHHWQMMISSAALVVLVPLFVLTFGMGLGGSFAEVQAYYARPFPALITVLTLIVGVFHLTHEAQAAVEDYMTGTAQKLTLIGLQGLAYVLIITGLFAIARIAL